MSFCQGSRVGLADKLGDSPKALSSPKATLIIPKPRFRLHIIQQFQKFIAQIQAVKSPPPVSHSQKS